MLRSRARCQHWTNTRILVGEAANEPRVYMWHWRLAAAAGLPDRSVLGSRRRQYASSFRRMLCCVYVASTTKSSVRAGHIGNSPVRARASR